MRSSPTVLLVLLLVAETGAGCLPAPSPQLTRFTETRASGERRIVDLTYDSSARLSTVNIDSTVNGIASVEVITVEWGGDGNPSRVTRAQTVDGDEVFRQDIAMTTDGDRVEGVDGEGHGDTTVTMVGGLVARIEATDDAGSTDTTITHAEGRLQSFAATRNDEAGGSSTAEATFTFGPDGLSGIRQTGNIGTVVTTFAYVADRIAETTTEQTPTSGDPVAVLDTFSYDDAGRLDSLQRSVQNPVDGETPFSTGSFEYADATVSGPLDPMPASVFGFFSLFSLNGKASDVLGLSGALHAVLPTW
jgi:hypothetical protein